MKRNFESINSEFCVKRSQFLVEQSRTHIKSLMTANLKHTTQSPKKIKLKNIESKSVETEILENFQRRNVNKTLGEFEKKYFKLRSCSLDPKGLSASLLDLQDKTVSVNENINKIVTKSIKSVKTFTCTVEEGKKTLSLSQISTIGSTSSKNSSNKLSLIRQASLASSLFSSGSGSCDSLNVIPRYRKKSTEVGKLNPSLYQEFSDSSSSFSSFGDIQLSHTWIGPSYDQLKIRILKIKNISEEFYRAGLYVRLQCVSPTAESPNFQSSTQYGEDRRYFSDDFVFKLPDNLKSLKIWGVVLLSAPHPEVVANFEHIFEQQKKSKVLKLPLIISSNECYNSKRNKLNIALKYSPKENQISIIIYKCILEGVFIEKRSNLYIKISVMENNKELCSKKIWCSNNQSIIDFSKEVFFNLNDRDVSKCSLFLQMKKYAGFGTRNEKISQLSISAHEKEERGMNHYEKMLFKPNERIFVWHSALCI